MTELLHSHRPAATSLRCHPEPPHLSQYSQCHSNPPVTVQSAEDKDSVAAQANQTDRTTFGWILACMYPIAHQPTALRLVPTDWTFPPPPPRRERCSGMARASWANPNTARRRTPILQLVKASWDSSMPWPSPASMWNPRFEPCASASSRSHVGCKPRRLPLLPARRTERRLL